MTKAFVIVRVSAEDQLKGYGPDVQWEDDVLPNVSGLGFTACEADRRIIQESATGWERPKFEAAVREAMELHNAGEIGAIVFPRVDRETRFIFGSMALLIEVVKTGLPVCFARERLTLDPKDPESVERYLSKATQAQAYVMTMKANTLRAKRKLLREGKLPQGTGVGIYGYIWDRATKKRIIAPNEAEIVNEIFSKVAAGDSLVSIARSLNQRSVLTKASKAGDRKYWHSLTIRRMVKNQSYVGKTYFGVTCRSNKSETILQPEKNWTLLEEVTPAIVSDDLFRQANAQMEKPKLRTGRPKHQYLLRNHGYCAICGKPLVGHCLNKKYLYYQCSNARPSENSSRKCSGLYIRADDLEETVWTSTRDVLSNPNIVMANLGVTNDKVGLDSLDAEISDIETTLHKYTLRRSNLLEAMELGEFDKDEILDRLNKINRSRHEDEIRLIDLRETRNHLVGLANANIKLTELYGRVLENLQCGAPEIRALAFDALDIKVYAKAGAAPEIHGVIPLESPTTEQTSA